MDGVATKCNIYRDNKKVCEYFDAGDGAPPLLRWVDKQEEVMAMNFAETLDDTKKYGASEAFEIYVEDLCNEYDRKKEERRTLRLLKKETWFRVDGKEYKEGEWQVVKAPYDEKVKAYLDKKYGEYTLYQPEKVMV